MDTEAQQLSREAGDRAGCISFQRWSPGVMAGAKLVWFQRRVKGLLEVGRPAAGREKMKCLCGASVYPWGIQ